MLECSGRGTVVEDEVREATVAWAQMSKDLWTCQRLPSETESCEKTAERREAWPELPFKCSGFCDKSGL